MSMRKKLLGGFLVVAVLAAASIAAALTNATEAIAAPDINQRATLTDYGVDAEQNETDSRPFIGISITSVPEDSDADGALIVRVLEGSPADGNLQADDIITALDGDMVDSPRDVVTIIRESSPGDVIVFSIVRDGDSMDVSVTVGEFDREMYGGTDRRHGQRNSKRFGHADERLILSDARYMTDDGVMTVRKAVGTAQNVDASAGSFDLLLQDESETLSFTINDDTKIAIASVEGEASIADLSADSNTTVMEVTHPDGAKQVRYVAQGDFSVMVQSRLGRHGYNRHHHLPSDLMSRMKRQESDRFAPLRSFFRWRNGDSDRENGRQ